MPASAPTAPAAGPAGTTTWLEALAGAPLPGRRHEDWRFTDLAAFTALAPRLIQGLDPLASVDLPAGVERLDGVAAQPWLGRALAATDCADHWSVRLESGASVAAAAPLLALKVSGAAGCFDLALEAGGGAGVAPFRLLVVLEAGASLELLLRPGSSGPSGLVVVSEVILGEGAHLKLASVAVGAAGSCLMQPTAVIQHPGSRFEHTAVSAGWALARQEPRVLQPNGGAFTRLCGLQVCRGQQLADTHSWVRFDGPDGELDQLHKAVADDQARSVFNGAVRVPRAAQRTQAAQLSRSLLLSDRARIDTKPELEIVADDVRCAHGATVSRLQANELFYLQSRGIAATAAAQLLQRAFCEEVLRELPAMAPRSLRALLVEPGSP